MNFRWIFVLATALGVGVGVIAACNGDSGGGDAGGDAAPDASPDGPLDAGSPHCFVDGGGSNDPAASPGFGSFTGAATGDVCLGGAFAVVQELPASDDTPAEALLVIETSDFGDPNTFIQFQSPIGVVSGTLAISIGLPSAVVGSYSSDGSCGNLGLCAVFPTPVVDCGDAAAPATCPDGCDFVEMGGPCTPATPEQCFSATGISDCAETPTTPQGSWQVVISAITPFADDASAEPELVVHGVFRGTLLSDDDAGAKATLTIGF